MDEYQEVDAVIFVCPVCKFEEFDSVEELMKTHGFDGKDFKTLPKFGCHCCHRSYVEPKEFRKIPASWLEPF